MSSVSTAETRMSASERRERILDAAAEVFGRRGYVGTTTDQVARAAGISQPYVVRLFGSKEALFLAVVERARDTLLAAFREVLGAATDEPHRALGERYVDLATNRGIHLPLMQSFLQGTDPVIGAAAREGYLAIWHLLRDEAGMTTEEARDFLARGMLISVLLGLDLPTAGGGEELLAATFGSKLELLRP